MKITLSTQVSKFSNNSISVKDGYGTFETVVFINIKYDLFWRYVL